MKSFIKSSISDKVYLLTIWTFIGIFTLAIVFPLLHVVSASFSSPRALVAGRVFLLPVEPGLQGYASVFRNSQVWSGYWNSIVYTTLATIIGTMVTVTGGYVLSRKEFPLRNFLTVFFAITMFFSGGMLPTFMLIRNLGMLDTMWALILPGALSVWLAIIARTFIAHTIPEELFESVSLDGGGYYVHFFQIVLPLSKALLAVLAINFAVGQWNSFFSALIYLHTPDKFPLQIILRNILISHQIDFATITGGEALVMVERQQLAELMKYSLIIVSSIPLLIVYPFIQRYFIKGIMIGSLKG